MSSILKVDTIQTAAGGTPTAADLGLNVSGNTLQIVTNNTNSGFTLADGTTTLTEVTNNSITPNATSSKIKITVCGVYYINNNASPISHHFALYRNGSLIPNYNWSQGSNGHYLQYRTSSINNHIPVPFNFTWVDTPSSTSPVNYQFLVRAANGSLIFYAGTTLILEEIAG